MNTYIVPIIESTELYIKKIIAKDERSAQEKLYQYFFNKYPELEGDTLEEITEGLWEFDADYGRIYDVDEFV